MPQKKFYRSRAHCNPLSFNENFDYPTRPDLMDWTEDHYPEHPLLEKEDSGEGEDDISSFFTSSLAVRPDVLDVGCGFGGLTLALSAALPERTILGLEIRPKVTEYVRLRILAQRKENPGRYRNCSVMRTNAMKYLPNFFAKASLEKTFFCFPDPHFKRKNHPRRIISERLLTEYAYLLKPDVGRLYCITDVEDLHAWHVDKCDAHPLFRKLTEEEMENDPCVALMKTTTEEGKKVTREGRFGHEMYYAVYGRVNDDEATTGSVTAERFFEVGQFGVEVVE
jgi:tRNA (guanine-N7-)-methyltransferase